MLWQECQNGAMRRIRADVALWECWSGAGISKGVGGGSQRGAMVGVSEWGDASERNEDCRDAIFGKCTYVLLKE